jgi:hypothetical protein
MNIFKRWIYGIIKDFFTLKWNKADWHQVTAVYEKYPDGFMSQTSITKLYYDGNIIDQVKYPIDFSEWTVSVWFNHNTRLPFLGREHNETN